MYKNHVPPELNAALKGNSTQFKKRNWCFCDENTSGADRALSALTVKSRKRTAGFNSNFTDFKFYT